MSEASPQGLKGVTIQTDLGWVGAIWSDQCLVATSLPQETKEAAARVCGITAPLAPPDCSRKTFCHDIARYFAGEWVDFTRHPIALPHVSPFVRRVLEAAREIPYGQVRTYGWVAARAGNAKAARAAGYAMSVNPLPLLVPCHRVIGAGGKLTGFGGGLPLKRALLELEGISCSADRVCTL
ncbi:MAG: methylated-DNA--[protein]-cysteine S-methyltransferase [Armatimonadetes bacterium]|nr:methylated-DNA--[protein]-cysteine S-methyltransferase [Armatimonadota bacterium]